MKKLVTLLLVAALVLCGMTVSAVAETEKRIITVDGGGDQNNFNSTASMEKSDANPYPYNELELIIEEYNASHPDVEVQLWTESKTNDRDTLVPLMTAGEGPDLVFQVWGTTKNADISTGWFVPLNDYFDMPNPYIEGNEHWSDIFNPFWLEVTKSMDGNYYYIPLDAIPVGLSYNMDLLAEAGVEKVPETFSEFMECQDKLNAIGVIPYLPIYHWYDIALEGQMLGNKVDELDVLTVDGTVDAEEFARGFEKGIISIEDEEYAEWMRIIKEKTKYYPEGWSSMDASTMFLNGEVAIVEAVGAHMRMFAADTTHTFTIENAAFPFIDEATSELAGTAIIRGSAGYSTAWQVNAQTIENGTIDDVIDFMMYLTTAETNARMINTFSSTTPANMDAECVDLFKPLMEMAVEDMNNGCRDWHACCAFTAFDNELNSIYENELYLPYIMGEIDAETFVEEFQYEMEEAIARAEKTANWDKTTW